MIIIFSTIYAQESNNGDGIHTELEEIIRNFKENGIFDSNYYSSILETTVKGSREYFQTIDALMKAYVIDHLHSGGKRIPAVEKILENSLEPEVFLNVISQAVKDGIINDFFDSVLTTKYEELNNYPEDLQDQISFTYPLKAKEIAPISHYYPILIEAYKNQKKWDSYFDLAGYYYYNFEEPNLFREVGLYLAYLRTQQKTAGSYKAAIQGIKNRIQEEVETEFPTLRSDDINDLSVMDYRGEKLPLDPRNELSPIYGKTGIIVYFNTGCDYCSREIQALKEISKILSEECKIILINTMYRNRATVAVEVDSFIRENSIPFETYIDVAGAQGVIKLGINGVPCILLTEVDGTIVKPIKFQYDGHLELKLEWVLSDYIVQE